MAGSTAWGNARTHRYGHATRASASKVIQIRSASFLQFGLTSLRTGKASEPIDHQKNDLALGGTDQFAQIRMIDH